MPLRQVEVSLPTASYVWFSGRLLEMFSWKQEDLGYGPCLVSHMQCLKCGWMVMDGVQALFSNMCHF